ncbi:MAG TPA: hypothetical protein VGP47_07985 [Parachlamydiaceae bacterium]|nr:hypothetical protein [Parachlamydiaceae bacterium]
MSLYLSTPQSNSSYSTSTTFSTSSCEDYTSSSEGCDEISFNVTEVDMVNEKIRKQANNLAWEHKFEASAKMYFQLFDKNVGDISDSSMIKNVILNLIKNSKNRDIRFSFREVNIIKSALKKILKECNDEDAQKLLNHLKVKTYRLKQDFHILKKPTLLFLKSQYDKDSFPNILPNDVIKLIANHCLASIEDINQTPVCISHSIF